jgi:AraC-like DNA-binding protein
VLTETLFQSADLPAADRFDCWRERLGHTHAPMDLTSDHTADFRAHQRVIGLGAVSVWPATFQPLVFRRTPKLIRQSDPESYHLSLLLRGEGGVSWGSQQAVYHAYDFHSNDSSRPSQMWTGPEPITTVGIEVPKTLLSLPRNRADQVIGRRMSGRTGVGALLAQFVTQLAADTGSYQPSDGPRLGIILTDLVAALFMHALDADDALLPETRQRTLTLHIRAFVQARLHDPGLTPAAIAEAHHISISYLHRLFQAEEDTVGAWIRRERLERARRDLADPALRGTAIHAVATRWGFPRAADFSRAFRAAYGVSPREYRDHAGQPSSGRIGK